MQDCNLIIDKRQIKHVIQKKAAPNYIKSQLKLHKIGIQIRPVFNNKTAPAYITINNTLLCSLVNNPGLISEVTGLLCHLCQSHAHAFHT
jgi:hypothetical protein